MRKVKWGVLSTAKIGVKEVIPAMQQGKYCEISAISSRSPGKAEQVAASLNIEKTAGSYEELLKLQDIEAIYNPLPNHLHVEWTIKALKAGKHVLCEKPIGLSFDDARKLSDELARHPRLKVMEAFMYRHHPRWVKVKELIDEHAIGKMQAVHSFFSYYNDDPENIRNKPEMGGGSLMDIGCYCISVPRFLFGQEPERVLGTIDTDPDLHIDRLTSGILEFEKGQATFSCATQLAEHQSVRIFGTDGWMEISEPFNPSVDKPTTIFLNKGGVQQEMQVDPCNQYTIQGDLFSKAILELTEVPTGLNDALANMKVIDAIVESSRESKWVTS